MNRTTITRGSGDVRLAGTQLDASHRHRWVRHRGVRDDTVPAPALPQDVRLSPPSYLACARGVHPQPRDEGVPYLRERVGAADRRAALRSGCSRARGCHLRASLSLMGCALVMATQHVPARIVVMQAEKRCPAGINPRCSETCELRVPCRPKRCEVCEKLMWGRDCPECGAPHGKDRRPWPGAVEEEPS